MDADQAGKKVCQGSGVGWGGARGGGGWRAPVVRASEPSGPTRVCLRVDVSALCAPGPVRREQRRGQMPQLAPSSPPHLPPEPGEDERGRRRGPAGAACACGCECECARASGGESGSHSGEAHTDTLDRRDRTRASEEAAAGAGPRAPARA